MFLYRDPDWTKEMNRKKIKTQGNINDSDITAIRISPDYSQSETKLTIYYTEEVGAIVWPGA